MSRRRGKSLSPSLFPFLAVLVCTLGTLILLLALVAQNATDVAQQQAQAEAAAQRKAQQPEKDATLRLTAAAAETLLREERFRAEQLVAFRNQQTEDLEARRDELTYLENQMAQLQKRLGEISDEVEQTLSQETDDRETRQAIAAIEAKIKQEEEQIERLEQETRGGQPRVVIVPHKGPNGTDRRPIYLECTSEGVTLWPEGSKISLQQLEQSTRSANPLDAALRVVRLHAMQHYGDQVAPYPLLVVRPEGIDAYGAARRAMRDWDDQFGYELVPADLPLAYHTADPELKDRIDLAVNQATALQRVRQQQLLGVGRGYLAGGARPPSTRAPSTRAPSTGSRSIPADRLPVLSAASLDRDGRRSGFGNLREPIGAGRGSYDPPPPSTTPLLERPSSNQGQTSVRGGAYTGSRQLSPSYQSPPGHAGINRKWEQEMEAAARELRQAASDRSGGIGRTGVANQSPLTDPVQSQRDGTTSMPGDGNTYPSDRKSNERGSDSTQGDETGFAESQTQRRSDTQRRGELSGRGDASPTESTAALASPDSSAAENQPAESRRDGNDKGALTNRAGQTSDQGQLSSGGPSAGGTQPFSNGSPTGSQMASASSVRSDQQQQQQAPSISNQQQPTLTRQGRDWALPDNLRTRRSGNSIVRTIRAECHEDRFVLVGTADDATEMFGLSSGDIDQATLRLATAIHDRIKRWGPALPGGHWQPRLEVRVSQGGQARFYQLHALMQNSGIEVIGRPMR